MPLKPRKPLVAIRHEPAPSITLVTPPSAMAHEDDLAVDVSFESIQTFSSTHPMLPRVARYESVDDFYGFAPHYSEPILPRMVTLADIEGQRPSIGRRVARALSTLAATGAVLAAVVVALAFVVSWKFNVPVSNVHAFSYSHVRALTDVGPVEREEIAVAPLAVQPHAPVTFKVPSVPRPGTARPGTVASTRL